MNTSLSIHRLLNPPLSCYNIGAQKAGPVKKTVAMLHQISKRSSCNSPKLYEDGLLLFSKDDIAIQKK